MVNYPLLNTFQIDDSTVNFLNKKFDQFSEEQELISSKESEDSIYISETGVHTGNLCLWKDIEYKNFVKKDLLDICSSQLGLDTKNVHINFTHFFDYRTGGEVKLHNHLECEDFVLFIYTNTCNSGDTIFYLNHHPDYKHRTKVKLKPTFGLGAIFSSMIYHEAEFTNESKRIFVVGIKVYLTSGD